MEESEGDVHVTPSSSLTFQEIDAIANTNGGVAIGEVDLGLQEPRYANEWRDYQGLGPVEGSEPTSVSDDEDDPPGTIPTWSRTANCIWMLQLGMTSRHSLRTRR